MAFPSASSSRFASIKSFFDPSVQFGLQFEANEETAEAASAEIVPAPIAEPAGRDEAETTGEAPKQGEGAEVVRLDRFRKK